MRHLFLTILLLLPTVALANTVERLTSIPFVNSDSLGGVVTGLFYLAIVIAGMLAVVKLVIAGAKYMMSDVVTTKQSAIGDIKGAIIGLLLILGTVVILDTINDQITNANLDLPELSLEGGVFGEGDDGGATPSDPYAPVDLTDASPESINNYGAACNARGDAFTLSVGDDGSVTGQCVPTEGGDESAELENPDEIAEYADECAANGQDFTQSPLPNGNVLGRCVSCTGGDIFNSDNGSCEAQPLTCDDGSPIENCRDSVTFDTDGNPTIEDATSGDEVSFDCSYEAVATAIACGNWCIENGGDYASLQYCSGAIIP